MNGATISEAEAISFLKAIENGSISLQPEQDPQGIYAGNVSYIASNGWFITVFNDANKWDYIDHIQSSDGRLLEFDSIDEIESLRNYEPSEKVAWSRYGMPGSMIFKCNRCGRLLNKRLHLGPPFLCEPCQIKQS